MRVIKRIGYGARNSVYEVVLPSGKRMAMKYLIQNTEHNRNRVRFEYELIQQLREEKLTDQSFSRLKRCMPELRENLD